MIPLCQGARKPKELKHFASTIFLDLHLYLTTGPWLNHQAEDEGLFM